MLWAFRYRFDPRHKYNILKTGLKPGYYDPDMQILYAVMNSFATWVETNDALDSKIILAQEPVFEETETEDYYQSRKESFDDFREAYRLWLKFERDPLGYSDRVCFTKNEHGKLEYNGDLAQEIKDESVKMVGLVVKHLNHLWY
jgi:hypothetical protein